MNFKGLHKVTNPFLMAFVSILVSEVAYILVSYLFGYKPETLWLIFTAIVSGSIAFTATSFAAKMMNQIQMQNQELERLNHLNQELFSTISHDIRSPLTGITLLLELVKTKGLKEKDALTLFNELSIDIEHLIGFLDELLVWSKRQIDKKPLQPEQLDTKPIIESTVLLYSRVLAMKDLTLTMDSISSELLVDKGSYSFILRNVLQNAIKFTPKGGTIRLLVEQKNGSVITKVSDNGIGMPYTKIENILSQGDYDSSVGTENETGVGFGLRASLGYLKKQKGSMDIITNQDQGTTVCFTLPKH